MEIDPRKSIYSDVRYWVAKVDYEDKRDLSWAKTDPCVSIRLWAAKADYENNKDLSWAKTDISVAIRYWAKQQEKDREKANGLDEKK